MRIVTAKSVAPQLGIVLPEPKRSQDYAYPVVKLFSQRAQRNNGTNRDAAAFVIALLKNTALPFYLKEMIGQRFLEMTPSYIQRLNTADCQCLKCGAVYDLPHHVYGCQRCGAHYWNGYCCVVHAANLAEHIIAEPPYDQFNFTY